MYQTTIPNKKGWSFKLMTAENRKRKDSTFPIGLILNFCGQRKLITLDISAKPKQWNTDFERFIVTASQAHPDALKCNAYLNSLSADLEEAVSDFTKRKIPFTNTMIIERLFADINYEYVKKYVQEQLKNGRKKGGISVNVRSLRTVLNTAILDNVGSP